MSMADLKELLRDDRAWVVSARVEAHDGEDQHFEINEEGDIIVQVKTVNHEVPIRANLDSFAGGSDGSGVWHIPDPGTEVLVAFDLGEFEGEAYIVGRTSGGRAPTSLVSGQVLVLGNSVQIRTPTGTAIELPTKADVQAVVNLLNDLISKYNSHSHTYIPGSNPTVQTSAMTPHEGSTAQNPICTTVLKAE